MEGVVSAAENNEELVDITSPEVEFRKVDRGSCPQLPGEDQPVVCCDCNSRGTVFLSPQKVQEHSPDFGKVVTLSAPVCRQELRKFRFVWICNAEKHPSQDPFCCMFEALGRSYCFCIALNRSSNNSVYSSRLFIVEPKKTTSAMRDHLTEATEETQRPMPGAKPTTAAARGSFDTSDPQAHRPVVVQPPYLQPNPSQSAHDSLEPMPSAEARLRMPIQCSNSGNAQSVFGDMNDSSARTFNTASLTQWERTQLEDVHRALERARMSIQNLAEKEEALRPGSVVDASQDLPMFKDITSDLYSALSYTVYLLQCHFSNKGQLDSSENARSPDFPYKSSGVKTSQKDAQDQRRKFVKDHLKPLWGSKLGQSTHFWRDIGKVFLDVQPKLKVDSSGTVIGDREPTTSEKDAESFALLHYYRNCSIHRYLVRFHPESDNKFWICLPEAIARKKDNEQKSRLLLEVLDQLIGFVKETTSKLLSCSLLLPSAKVLLREHFANCRMEETKFKPAAGMQNAEVTVTTEQGEKVVVSSSGGHKLQAEAEEEACISVIRKLAKRDILPNPPYSFLTPHHVQPYPPVQFLDKTADKTYRMLMNEYGQRLAGVGLKLKLDCIGPDPVTDREQHYSARVDLSMTRTADGDGGEEEVVRILSGDHEAVGKDKAKEAAVAEVAEECIRLGLIQLQ